MNAGDIIPEMPRANFEEQNGHGRLSIMLRQHQSEVEQTKDVIIAGAGVRVIVVDATPGAGKSILPILAGQLIPAGLADKLAWIVPRKSLQTQAEAGFVDSFFRNLLGHNLSIRTSTNDVDPCRGLDGFVTTYQALGMSNGILISEFTRKKYILILDEFHHVSAADSLWMKALKPLVEKAAFVVMMTGTMQRGDGEKIAFLKYRYGRPVFDADTKYIEYGRTMALQERAIIPLRFYLLDGNAAWKDRDGQEKTVDSLAGAYLPKERSAALYTALRTDFAKELLNASLEHWHRYRARTGHMSAFLSVTADVKHAKQVLKYLHARGLNAEIATSHDSPQAHKAIKNYKAGLIDVLVSVAMAYEGLDVPRITHAACLTQIRSEPWIEQMLARAVRVDRSLPYEQQEAFVFAPDDPLFRRIVNGIKAEQSAVAIKDGVVKDEREESDDDYGAKEPDVIPIGSSITGDRSIFLGGPRESVSTQEPAPMPKTPTEIEEELRKEIKEHVHEYCKRHHINIQKMNKRIRVAMGKGRPEMTLKELKKTRAFIQEYIPLIRKGRGTMRKPKAVVCAAPPVQGVMWETNGWRI